MKYLFKKIIFVIIFLSFAALAYSQEPLEFTNTPTWVENLFRWVSPLFFPLAFISKFPGYAFLQFPLLFGSLLGAFMLEGWMRNLCIYVCVGTLVLMLPWIMLLLSP